MKTRFWVVGAATYVCIYKTKEQALRAQKRRAKGSMWWSGAYFDQWCKPKATAVGCKVRPGDMQPFIFTVTKVGKPVKP